MALEVGVHDGADVKPPETDRRGNHEPSARSGALALSRNLGLFDIGENAPGAFEIARTRIRQCHRPRRPLQQTRAETIFQRRNQPRHARRRKAKLSRGRSEPLEIRNRHKSLHGIEAIHGIISYIAMI